MDRKSGVRERARAGVSRRPCARIARLLALTLAAAFGLSACSISGQTGRPFDPAGVRKLETGWSTRDEVRYLFGEPRSVTPGPDATETWVYEHTLVTALTLPLYGMVRARQTPHRLLTIRFRYGLVADCTYFEERYASRGVEVVPTQSATERCER